MVRAKKHLGQHFLKEASVAERTAKLAMRGDTRSWLEIGPGTGMLTQFLLAEAVNLKCIEVDTESVEFLHENYPELEVIEGDFLNLDLAGIFNGEFGVIGNFPYNISSQIVFRILESRDQIPEFIGMFQLEVAQRIAASSGSKTYGILSVLTQAFYDVKLEFRISPGNFNPPPKVQSGVLRAVRKDDFTLDCDETLFFNVVKTAFQQRRKTLGNALRKFNIPKEQVLQDQIFKLRAEKMEVSDYVHITRTIQESR